MDMLKQLIDAAKLALYELLAVLLPGVILAEAVAQAKFTNYDVRSGALRFLVVSYVLGLATQGLANIIFRRIPARVGKKLVAPHVDTRKLDGEEAARRSVEKLLGYGVKSELLFGFCLSSLGASRSLYDKFLALRDTARALAVVLPVAGIIVALGPHLPLYVETFGFVIAMLGLLDRYFRFKVVGDEFVFAQFLADQTQKPSPKAQDAGAGQK